MQNDNYYKKLLVEYYQADTLYLKKKYKKSFREIFKLLEEQEKNVLKLQEIILELESQKKIGKVISLFSDRKSPNQSFRGFQNNLFSVDTSKPIDKKLYTTTMEILGKLEFKEKRWKQIYFIF